jgi:hypothetical protein
LDQALGALTTKPVNWTAPAGLKTVPGYVQQGFSDYGAEFPGPTDDVYPSWYVGKGTSIASSTVDKVSGFLATSCTPALAKQTIGGGSDSSFSIDIFYPKTFPDMAALEGGGASTTSAATTQTDNVHSCNDTPPSVTVTAASSTGSSGDCNASCTITVAATAGTHPLSGGSYTTSPAGTIDISLNGTSVCSLSIPPDQSQTFNGQCSYTPSSSGSGTLTATVVDSVLYSSTNSITLNYSTSATGSSTANTTPSP